MRFKRVVRSFWGVLLPVLLGFALLSLLLVTSLRWLDPPTSSFMVRHWVAGWLEGRQSPLLHHEWADLDAIAQSLPLAVIAAEDQRFLDHQGFDLVEMQNAWRDFRSGGRLRGASTLSQQVAKNLFLWSDKSIVRKGLEAWFTILIELAWPKRRILEVYLNIAQFGPDTFGVGAAAWRYFDRPPGAVTVGQAALMAAVLPNPERFRLESPTRRLRQRAERVRQQMRQLGAAHLDRL
jgi:monofunctional biosynthetic peptidoglycan transglycosylase